MSGHKTIHAPDFDSTITLRDAYRAMELFVSEYHARGDTPVVDFLTYLSIADDGVSSDPTALYDFLAAVEKLRKARNANV